MYKVRFARYIDVVYSVRSTRSTSGESHQWTEHELVETAHTPDHSKTVLPEGTHTIDHNFRLFDGPLGVIVVICVHDYNFNIASESERDDELVELGRGASSDSICERRLLALRMLMEVPSNETASETCNCQFILA